MWLSLAVGGVVGTLARYELGRWVHNWVGTSFPWGTLAINIAGSFLLGMLTRYADSSALSAETRGMLTVGFCGAFTTFSTFTYEAVMLIQDGEAARALLYAFGSLGLGILAMMAGLALVETVVHAGG